MHDLRELKEAGEAGSDDEHRAETALQKLTDQRIGEIDALLAGKEEEILRSEARAVAARNVAIIMDGNARWASERGLHVLAGHRAGAKALKRTVRDAVELDVDELTVFAFSTENWTRPRTRWRDSWRCSRS